MKPEWGTKRICQSCSVPFYDMRRTPIVCPKCGSAFDPEVLTKARRSRPQPVEEKAKKVPVAAKAPDEEADIELELPEEGEELEELAEETAGAEEEDVIEDASELGQDDSVVGKVEKDDEPA